MQAGQATDFESRRLSAYPRAAAVVQPDSAQLSALLAGAQMQPVDAKPDQLHSDAKDAQPQHHPQNLVN